MMPRILGSSNVSTYFKTKSSIMAQVATTDQSPHLSDLAQHRGGLLAKWCLTLVTPWTVACLAPL